MIFLANLRFPRCPNNVGLCKLCWFWSYENKFILWLERLLHLFNNNNNNNNSNSNNSWAYCYTLVYRSVHYFFKLSLQVGDPIWSESLRLFIEISFLKVLVNLQLSPFCTWTSFSSSSSAYGMKLGSGDVSLMIDNESPTMPEGGSSTNRLDRTINAMSKERRVY